MSQELICNTLASVQNGQHFVDNSFKYILKIHVFKIEKNYRNVFLVV